MKLTFLAEGKQADGTAPTLCNSKSSHGQCTDAAGLRDEPFCLYLCGILQELLETTMSTILARIHAMYLFRLWRASLPYTLGLYRGYIGIMEKKVETTI